MRASLDTNVIIHFYRAGLQNILFEFFDEGVFIYEQIRNIELENHGEDVLDKVDADIASGKIEVYTDETLKELSVLKITTSNLNWAFKSQVAKFIKRFFKDPYREEDTKWIKNLANENNVNIKEKFIVLSKLI